MPNGNIDTAQDWLSLQEASDRMGVPASTLRRWADEGRVPMKRTLGGHRRFSAAVIMGLVSEPQQSVVRAQPANVQWGVDEQELARQEWHARFVNHGGTEHMRGLGQRLLGLLMQYVNRRTDDTRFLGEARGVGKAYGMQARHGDVALHDTVEAFLFFRGSFARLALPLPGVAQPTDLDEAALLHTRIDHFMDAVLLGVIEGYEQQHA